MLESLSLEVCRRLYLRDFDDTSTTFARADLADDAASLRLDPLSFLVNGIVVFWTTSHYAISPPWDQ